MSRPVCLLPSDRNKTVYVGICAYDGMKETLLQDKTAWQSRIEMIGMMAWKIRKIYPGSAVSNLVLDQG